MLETTVELDECDHRRRRTLGAFHSLPNRTNVHNEFDDMLHGLLPSLSRLHKKHLKNLVRLSYLKIEWNQRTKLTLEFVSVP